jgi:hypothetical protein
MSDCVTKGRNSRPPVHLGEAHHNAKFGAREALEISQDKRPAHVVAAQYGVSTKTVYRLRRNETWKGLQREA